MSFTQIDFVYDWTGGFSTIDVSTLTRLTPDTDADYGPAIIPGAPNDPTSYKIQSFAAVNHSVGPAVAAPVSDPYFFGFAAAPQFNIPVGVALCTGPDPVVNPNDPTLWSVDPADLTVLRSWQLSGPADTIATWTRLTIGEFYYIVYEGYGGGGLSGRPRIGQVGYVSPIGIDHATPMYLGGPEQIVPVGTSFDLDIQPNFADGPFDVDIDWGDGNTEHHTYIHSGEGTIVDDWWDFADILLPHTYAAPGLFTITVTASDALGGTATATVLTAAVGPPTASFTVPGRVALPGTVDVNGLTGHSDAWELMASGTPATNPDGYDPTAGEFSSHGPRTYWTFEVVCCASAFASDHSTAAQWSGPGEPPNNPDPPIPLPDSIWFPDDSNNEDMRAAAEPAVIELVLHDVFITWSQEVVVDADIIFGAPWLRNVPRDDGNGISTARSFPPQVDSIRSYPRIP